MLIRLSKFIKISNRELVVNNNCEYTKNYGTKNPTFGIQIFEISMTQSYLLDHNRLSCFIYSSQNSNLGIVLLFPSQRGILFQDLGLYIN
jgi:hypothetical protein